MTMTVREFCRSDCPAVEVNASIREAASKMKEHGIRWLTVTTDGAVMGLVSDWDIIRKSVIEGLDRDRTPVETIMRIGLPTCSADAPLEFAAEIMKRKRVRHIAVVNEARAIIGIVRAEDIVRMMGPDTLKLDLLLAIFK